jgi:hypothetical protein
VKEKYKKIKLVYTSSSRITSICNETTNGVSCGRERGEGVEEGDMEVGKRKGDMLKR